MARKPVLVDVFSGAGGLSLGFAVAGYEIALGVDVMPAAIRTFARNFPDASTLSTDIRAVSARDIRERTGSEIDVLIGGPSCQGFSTSGGLSRKTGRDLYDPRNSLFAEYVRLVKELAPAWIVFENVPGLLLYHRGLVALEIMRMLGQIGYSVQPMILLAADYGVPQLRRRLIFIGNRTGRPIRLPVPSHGNPNLWKGYALPFGFLSQLGQRNGAAVAPHITFDHACADLPPVREGKSIDGLVYPKAARSAYQESIRRGSETIRQHTAFDLSDRDREAIHHLKPGQNWRALPPELLPERFRRIRSYDATTALRRLRGNEPSYTITTKFNEATTGAFIHPRQHRTLTIREAARLQSFPDRFVFDGTGSQVRHQIGNAVPPLLAQAVAEAIWPEVTADVTGTRPEEIRGSILLEQVGGDVLRLNGARKKTKAYVTTTYSLFADS